MTSCDVALFTWPCLKGFVTLTRHDNAALGASYAHHSYGPDLVIVASYGDQEPTAVASYGQRHLLGTGADKSKAQLGSTYKPGTSPSTRIALKIPKKYNKYCQVGPGII
jgi:hypothetical protein